MSKQQSAEQILLSKVLELSDALNEEKQRALSQAQTISKLTSQHSMLASKTQEQQSIIAALRTEISETQDINRSLHKDNLSLIQENDDLRYNHGIETLKGIDGLKKEISRQRSEIDDLKTQVNHSNVAAVNKAYKELEENDRKATKAMKDFQTYAKNKADGYVDEIKKKDRTIKFLNRRIESGKSSLWLYRDLLFLYALCSLAANPVILQDIDELFTAAGLLLEEYYEWILCPRYSPYPGATPQPYAPGVSWAIRIASVIAGLALVALLAYSCRRLYSRTLAQWCQLAVRITVSLFIIVSVMGALIKEYLQWNTAVLFFILCIISLMLMRRFEVLYAHSDNDEDWEKIKDHKDKSYFITYHIYQLFTLIGKKLEK